MNNNPLNPVIGVRSFGEKPELVSEMVVAYQRGLQENGVMATAKHFPGHGDTSVDSHADLPVLKISRSRMNEIELAPFKAAINNGIQSIMVGHLALPILEKDLNVPATLSVEAVTKLLREELGFKGLIVSDGLGMSGVTKHFNTGEIAVRALAAGIDQLLLSEDAYIAKGAIISALQSGRITTAQLDAAVFRILQAKENAKLHENRFVKIEDIFKTVMSADHIALATEIAQQSLTLLKNERTTLPIRLPIPPSIKRGATSCLVLSLNDDSDPKAGDTFYEQMLTHIRTAQHVLLDGRATEREFSAAFEKAKLAKSIVIPTYFSSAKSISAKSNALY